MNPERIANERDSLAAQVAALREALKWFSHTRDIAGQQAACRQNPPQECFHCHAHAVLADTEAAATAHDREQRLAGAREFGDRWRKTYGFLDRAQQTEVLEAMEHEA